MEHKPRVIGITGHPASGKDTIADYLATRGFTKISLGDVIREQMTALGIPLDREHMSEFARKMRAEKGNRYPVDDMVERITGDTVVAGIRNTSELEALKTVLGGSFTLIAVETPLAVRYERARLRRREGDEISFEQFKLEDERERAAQSGSHEVDLVIKAANTILANDGTMEDLFRKVDEFIKRSGKFYRVTVGGIGIYEAVDRDCPKDDPRRASKPDGSWLPKKGADFPGAISLWSEYGFWKYKESGLMDWHTSVVSGEVKVTEYPHPEEVLYEDEFQVILENL